MCRATRESTKKVQRHLPVFSELFVLNVLPPHPSGKGKKIYLPLDCGLAGHLGASLERRLHICLLNERLAAYSCSRQKRPLFYYYRSLRKNFIHLVEHPIDGPLKAYQLFDQERIKKTDLALLTAFARKNPEAEIPLFAPILEPWNTDGIPLLPWEHLGHPLATNLTAEPPSILPRPKSSSRTQQLSDQRRKK